jgi:hypothetical protein
MKNVERQRQSKLRISLVKERVVPAYLTESNQGRDEVQVHYSYAEGQWLTHSHPKAAALNRRI